MKIKILAFKIPSLQGLREKTDTQTKKEINRSVHTLTVRETKRKELRRGKNTERNGVREEKELLDTHTHTHTHTHRSLTHAEVKVLFEMSCTA